MMNKIKNHFEKVCAEKKEALMNMWENPYQHESLIEYAERMYREKN